MNAAHGFYIFCNVGIAVGYLFVGLIVLPRTTEFFQRLVPFVKVRLHWTTIGGTLFLITCSITHLEQAFHLVGYGETPVEDVVDTWHMLLNHAVQLVGVWTLIIGSFAEFVAPVARALTKEDR